MIRTHLPPAEAKRLDVAFRSTDDRKFRDRLQIVRRANSGHAHHDIATDLGVNRKTVTRWLNAYCDGGLDALRPRKAPGKAGHIPAALAETVKQWVIGGPAAFLIVLGPLLAERLLQGVERGGAAARALAICVLVAAASGVMEAEVERIWQFLVPLAAVAAAPYATARRWVWLGLAAGLLQAYAIELHWDTTF